jgi:hypothetical protein
LSALALAVGLSCNSDTPTGPGDDGGGNDDTTVVRPDTIAPTQVTDPTVVFNRTIGIATFSWSAPHDDAPDQPADRYEIRYAQTSKGVLPTAFWSLSIPVSNPPAPGVPGTPQQVEISGLTQYRDLWVGIRSYDAAGNRSPDSDLVSVRIPGPTFAGRCLDVYTDNPIPGLPVQVGGFNVTTDASGLFAAHDLPPGIVPVTIADNPAPPDYHRMNQAFVVVRDTSHTFEVIPVQATISPSLGGITLLAFFKQITFVHTSPFLLAKWKRTPVPTYIEPFVNANGLDYEAISRNGAQRWMDRTGQPLFDFVSQPPDTGIVVHRRPPGIGTATTFYEFGDDKHPIFSTIEVDNDLNDSNFLFKVMMHEFGHTIRLDHFHLPEFIMYFGQPLPPDITDDEANLVTLYQAMPLRVDMTIYDESDGTTSRAADIRP